MFKSESWFSALPTDSQVNFIYLFQVVSSIFIKHLEDIFRENNLIKPFLVNYPLTPKIEKGTNSLTYYQINPPGVQPHFNVFYEDREFNCVSGRDNFFYASVVLLLIMKVKFSGEAFRKLQIDEFLNMIINY